MLKNDIIWPKSCRFKSQSEWEPAGFFSECLCNATTFDLLLGFFGSSAINVLSDGFATFLYSGGKMRLIINDLMSAEDKDAIQQGKSNNLLPAFDLSNIEALKNTLSERDVHFFECLAWLIRNDRIELRIIAPKDEQGIAHTKCGVFSDGINKVAFDGSVNFSRTALLHNKEGLTAMCDWNGDIEVAKIEDIESEFNRTFAGDDDSVNYIDAKDIRTRITNSFEEKDLKELLEDEAKQLDRTREQLSTTVVHALRNARIRVQKAIDSFNANIETDNTIPHFPFPAGPRPYQNEAFENWKNNNQKGLFAMATGTGKTITALNCLLEIYKRNGYYKAIILVPTIVLVDQWETECYKFNFKSVIKVCSKYKGWNSDIDIIKGIEDCPTPGVNCNYIIISTYASFIRDKVFNVLNSFSRKKLLFIADEAHNMGSRKILNRLGAINYLRRIGLSATPERQFDEEGNAALSKFFGCENGYTFEYTMDQAIKGKNPVLCKYNYYPHIVHLTDEEMSKYVELSVKLAKVYNIKKNSFPDGDDYVTSLLLARKRIIHKAQNKLALFERIIKNRIEEKGNLRYTLVYVPEGNITDDDYADIFDNKDYIDDDQETAHLIDLYTSIVKKTNSHTTVKQFISGSSERDKLLSAFASGELEVLTSMKCLDEGVDVPRSEMAIFCASTGNKRQFIQRRGRILRTHKDKHRAIIHDMVVAPVLVGNSDSYEMEKRLLEKELERVKDFARLSENPDFTVKELENITNYYNIPLY